MRPRLEVFGCQEPSDVRPPETTPTVVRVFVRISGSVVLSVCGGPPDGPPLCTGGSDESPNELMYASRHERFVGKVAMVEACDGEHAHEVSGDGGDDFDRAQRDEPDADEAHHVENDERHNTRVVNVLG